MDYKKCKTTFNGYAVTSVALFYIFSVGFGFSNSSIAARTNLELPVHKGTVITIQSENGDVIDCVDIYKQPAFDHPLVKNHSIQMKPSSFPKESKEKGLEETDHLSSQIWLKTVDCPKGTIPIIRTQKFNLSYSIANNLTIGYAQTRLNYGTYMGAQAYINAWKPRAAKGQYSSAQIFLVAGESDADRNFIQAGWMVRSPNGNGQTRFAISWTIDGYKSTGCINLDCPGFVQTSRYYYLGTILQDVSTYGGTQKELKVAIHKDFTSGNWWLVIGNNIIVGYWPSQILTELTNAATYIYWGGEASFDAYSPESTEMGSGHLAEEGWTKACFFRNLVYVDSNGSLQDVKDLKIHALNPWWYDVVIPKRKRKYFGKYFYFGGPGLHF